MKLSRSEEMKNCRVEWRNDGILPQMMVGVIPFETALLALPWVQRAHQEMVQNATFYASMLLH